MVLLKNAMALATGSLIVSGSLAATAPNYHGCLPGTVGADLKWCDHTLSHTERIQELLSILTVDEKIGLLSPAIDQDYCNDHTAGAPRVGLSMYMWLVEANTAANSACIGGPENKCSTTFNGPLGMGASFNRTSWNLKGNVIGTELRAYNNVQWYRDTGKVPQTQKIGLTGFGPNLNNPRDPRFGRLSELPSEDPYHAGHYAVQMLAGQQEMDKNGHPKMISFLKHFTAYSKEAGRGHDTYNISMFDLHDSYLKQYRIAFTQGTARGVMCSYDAENGTPSCANSYLLNTVMRKDWKQPDAFVSTDCGAVTNLRGAPAYAGTDLRAAYWVINNGTDLEMGSALVRENLRTALILNKTSEAIIDEAARRSLVHLFAAGRFDKLEDIEWSKYNEDDVASAFNHQVRDEAALQSFVLLKNTQAALPLKKGTTIAVVGPQATGLGLFSDYYGDEICPGEGHDGFKCVKNIAEAIAAANTGGTTTNATGVDINSQDSSRIQAALDIAMKADVVVLALGIDKSIEHEGLDRTNITLPGLQSQFAMEIYKLNKPTVLVLTNGGPIAIDDVMGGADAIVETFNPAFGTPMLAKTLFGEENRWGKLPYTIYPANYVNEQNMSNYDMSVAPGRTYRYYTGKPLFKYGEGMSYTSFDLQCGCGDGKPGSKCATAPPIMFACTVKNTGAMAGDEVVEVFHQAGASIRSAANHPVPIKSLAEFARVRLDPSESTTISFTLPAEAFTLIDESGGDKLYSGERSIVFSRGNGVDVEINVTL